MQQQQQQQQQRHQQIRLQVLQELQQQVVQQGNAGHMPAEIVPYLLQQIEHFYSQEVQRMQQQQQEEEGDKDEVGWMDGLSLEERAQLQQVMSLSLHEQQQQQQSPIPSVAAAQAAIPVSSATDVSRGIRVSTQTAAAEAGVDVAASLSSQLPVPPDSVGVPMAAAVSPLFKRQQEQQGDDDNPYIPRDGVERKYFDLLFDEADVTKCGFIEGRDAVSFLLRSGIDIAVLREIWAEADYQVCLVLFSLVYCFRSAAAAVV